MKVKCWYLTGSQERDSMLILGWVTVLKLSHALEVLLALPVSCASYCCRHSSLQAPTSFAQVCPGSTMLRPALHMLFLPWLCCLGPQELTGAQWDGPTYDSLSCRLSETAGVNGVGGGFEKTQEWRDNLSTKLETYISNSLIDFSTWISSKYFKFFKKWPNKIFNFSF